MARQSLRDFLERLERTGRLKRVAAPVDPELEITEIVDRLYAGIRDRPGGGTPALLFENVKDSSFPVLVNLLGRNDSIRDLLGGDPEDLSGRAAGAAQGLLRSRRGGILGWAWKERDLLLRLRSAAPQLVGRSRAKDVALRGAEVRLSDFPVLKCWPLDGGRFVTAGLVITRSPVTGERNLGIYRLQVHSDRELLLHWQIEKGGGFHFAEAEERNEPLEVAVVIGSDPLLWLAGVLPLPEGMDEIAFSGMLSKEPVEMVRCETLDLAVPASAEIVIEGIARPGRRAPEGPFGDHFGHYSHAAPFPVLEVGCVTHRRDAIYHASIVGKPPQEDRAMGETAARMFLPALRLIKRELRDLWAYYEAGFHNLLVVSVKQRYSREGLKTALGLLGEGQLSLSKCVVLVDPAVDVRDFSAVLRAIRDHFDPEKDFTLLSRTAQDTLDFTGPKMNHGSKMILDATGSVPGWNSIHQSVSADLAGSAARSDPRVLECRLMEGTLLVARVRRAAGDEPKGREILAGLLSRPELRGLKMAAVVSEDVPLDSDVLTLWGIFSRFDCGRDVIFTRTGLRGSIPVYSGTLGIDATWKKGYPLPVEMTAGVREKVSARWKEYGLEGI